MKFRGIFCHILWFVFFFVSAAAGAVADEHKEQKIQVFFRYDDFSATSNTMLDSMVFSIFEKAGVQLAVGIIPFAGEAMLPVPDEKSELLRGFVDAGVVLPALHGYDHVFFEQGRGEFAGRSYEDQYRRIKAGKIFLEESLGVPVRVFIPPWNEYDENTLRVLYEQGFDLLSAGVMDVPAVPDFPMRYLPAVSLLHGLKKNISLARRSNDPSPAIVVLIHSYDIDVEKEDGSSPAELATMLDWISLQSDLVTPRWDDLPGSDFSYERLLANQKGFMSQDKLPLFLWAGVKDVYLPSVYWSREYVPVPSRWYYVLKVIVYSLIGIFLGLFVMIRSGKFFIRLHPAAKYLIPIFTLAAMLLVYFYTTRGGDVIGWLSWPVLMVLVGVFAGSVLVWVREKQGN